MGVIALLSSRYFGSDETASVFQAVARILLPSATPERLAILHAVTRKLAHLTEYAILVMLWIQAFRPGRSGRRAACLAVVVAGLYAIVDEARQGLAPNRTPSAVDVAIDALGALLAAVAWRPGETVGTVLWTTVRVFVALGLGALLAAGALTWRQGLPPWEWLAGTGLAVLFRGARAPWERSGRS
jgi:VanZ family protein